MDFVIFVKNFTLLCVFVPLCCSQFGRSQNTNQKLLQTMKSYMNPKVNPCQDFYQYACGNWENLKPPNEEYLDTMGSLEYKINQKLKYILEQRILNYKNETNDIYFKVREYYQACRGQKTFNAVEYLRIIKPDERLEWPLGFSRPSSSSPPRESWNIWSSLGRLQTVGFNGFLINLEMRNRNATHFRVYVGKSRSSGLTSYEQRLLDEMDDSREKKTRLISQNIQNFLKKLAILNRNHKEAYAEEITFGELQHEVAYLVDFQSYFSAIWQDETLLNLPLMVNGIGYFRQLGDLVKKTSSVTLIHTLKIKFLGYLEKQMPRSSSSVKCLQHMRDLMPLALDYVYEKEIFQYERNSTEVLIQRLFKKMQRKFANIITEHAEDLTHEEISFLEDKIFKMKLNIGNLPLATDDQYYHEYFNSWKVYADPKGRFYWNHLNALQHQSTEKFNMLNLQWFSPIHSYFYWPYGSPAYQPSTNLLIIPHTYLQYPIFHVEFHELFLYAELGNSLGHEMLHAFDTNGLQYDSHGNPSTLFIKSLPDKKSFMASLECLGKQRALSLNEKIADFSGFRLAYDTYFQRPTTMVTKFHGRTNLSNKQLFFIKFAQFFCAVHPKRIHYDDTHDTPFIRVPQVVANHVEFEEVFNCQRATVKKGVLQEKCNMW